MNVPLNGISGDKLPIVKVHIFFKEANCEKKSEGIWPENWLWAKYRDLRAPSWLKGGIGPEKELLTKLMERRVGIWVRALTSMAPERERSTRWRLLMMLLKQMTPSHLEEQGFWLGTQEERATGLENDFLRLRRASFSEREREEKGKRRRRRRRTAAIAVPEILWVFRERNGPLLGEIEVL